MRRALILSLLIFGLAAPAASAQDPVPTPTPAPPAPPPEPVIRAAVSVAGVQVGGLTVAQARATLEQAFAVPYAANVAVYTAGRRFTAKPSRFGFAFLGQRTAQRAFNAGAAAPPAPDGTVAPLEVKPAIRYKRAALRAWVQKIAARVAVAPRDARVRITLRRIFRFGAHTGRRLDQKPVRVAVAAALADPRAVRLIKAKRAYVKPKLRKRDLARVYATVITIDRAHFRLRLFKRLRVVARYGVAVGMPAYPTPTGLYSISSKQVNPTWTAPNAPWAGELAGTQVSGNDPTNPLKARWMGIVGGVGIHGTGQEWTIGSRASHGCIRMRVADVIALYRRVPLGTPVLIR